MEDREKVDMVGFEGTAHGGVKLVMWDSFCRLA